MENDNLMKEEKILSLMDEYLKRECAYRKVGSIKWDTIRYAPVDNTLSNEYDGLTIRNFLILYKIDRLESLGIINDTLAKHLRDLYYLRLELGEKIGAIALHNEQEKNDELNKIISKYNEIEDIFKKYHLISENFDLKRIIDTVIANEDYSFILNPKKEKRNLYSESAEIEEIIDDIQERRKKRGY